MKLTEREKNLIIIAVTFLICSLILTYLILPVRDQYVEARNNLAKAEQKLAETKSAQKPAVDSEKELKAMTVQMAAYSQQLPRKDESSELLFYINQAASKSGVTLERFERLASENSKDQGADTSDKSKKSEPKEIGNVIKIPYRVRAMGNYQQVHKFLTETETLKRITHNRSVTINQITAQNNLECLLEFETFVNRQGNGKLKPVSDIPTVKSGRTTLFIY